MIESSYPALTRTPRRIPPAIICQNFFTIPLTKEEWQVVDRYGQQMLQGIVSAVSQAMKTRKEAISSMLPEKEQ